MQSDDFSSQIAEMKKINADIVCGIFTPPQFAIFWTQCAQQGFKPKIVTPAKALLFPTSVEALGDRGVDMSTEVWWSHHHPFKSGLTGQTAQQFCDAYEKRDRQAVDAAARLQARQSRSGDRRAQARQEARAERHPRGDRPDRLSVDRRPGEVEGGGPNNPVPNVSITPLVGGQWKKGKKFKYDLDIAFNGLAPNIPIDSPFEAIKYS